MQTLADIAIGTVALLHLLFLVVEMFLWKRPVGRRIFGLSRDLAQQTATLAANQGLYNGFLAAGLIWGLIAGPQEFGVRLFFTSCVVLAGVFGAVTASRTVLWVQALPGAIALVLVWITGSSS